MTQLYVQKVNAYAYGASSITPSLSGTVATNNAVLVVFWLRPASTAPAAPSGWTVGLNVAGTLDASVTTLYGTNYYGGISIFYRDNLPGGTLNPTVTLEANSGLHVEMAEFSGGVTSSSLDQTKGFVSSGAVTGSQSTGSTAAPTTQADELVIAACGYGIASGSVNATISTPATTGYTSLVKVDNGLTTDMPFEVSYKIISATGTQSATWTLGSYSGQFYSVLATFKASVGGGSPKLKIPSSLNGLGAGGPFFHNRLG